MGGIVTSWTALVGKAHRCGRGFIIKQPSCRLLLLSSGLHGGACSPSALPTGSSTAAPWNRERRQRRRRQLKRHALPPSGQSVPRKRHRQTIPASSQTPTTRVSISTRSLPVLSSPRRQLPHTNPPKKEDSRKVVVTFVEAQGLDSAPS